MSDTLTTPLLTLADVEAARIRIAGKVPELWHPDSGKMEMPALYHEQDGRTTVPIHFDPSGSVFVIFHRPATGDADGVGQRRGAQRG